jgi:hypothetical protein
MIDSLGLPAKQAGRQTSDFAGEGKFGPGHQTNGCAEVVDVGEAARSGTEITRYKLVAHLRGARPHALEAKVTHGDSFPPELMSGAFNAPITPTVASRHKNGAGTRWTFHGESGAGWLRVFPYLLLKCASGRPLLALLLQVANALIR